MRARVSLRLKSFRLQGRSERRLKLSLSVLKKRSMSPRERVCPTAPSRFRMPLRSTKSRKLSAVNWLPWSTTRCREPAVGSDGAIHQRDGNRCRGLEEPERGPERQPGAGVENHHQVEREEGKQRRDAGDVEEPEVVRAIPADSGGPGPVFAGFGRRRLLLADASDRASGDLPGLPEEHLGDLLLASEAGLLHLANEPSDPHGEAADGWNGDDQGADGGKVGVASHLVEPVVDGLWSDEEAPRRLLDGEQIRLHVLEDLEPQRRCVATSSPGIDPLEAGGEDLVALASLAEEEASVLQVDEERLGGGAFVSLPLPGSHGAQRQILGGLEEGALGVTVVRAASGIGRTARRARSSSGSRQGTGGCVEVFIGASSPSMVDGGPRPIRSRGRASGGAAPGLLEGGKRDRPLKRGEGVRHALIGRQDLDVLALRQGDVESIVEGRHVVKCQDEGTAGQLSSRYSVKVNGEEVLPHLSSLLARQVPGDDVLPQPMPELREDDLRSDEAQSTTLVLMEDVYGLIAQRFRHKPLERDTAVENVAHPLRAVLP